MKQLKTILAALLMLCCATLSAHDFEVDGIFYNILSKENKTVEVTYKGDNNYDYNEYIGEVTIPANVTYNGATYNVTTIGNSAFENCTSLTSIEIPNSVTTIGEYAFYYCYDLTSIEIPNSVTTIGFYAFGYCRNLTSIEIPNSVTTIGDYAFNYCTSLTSIEIPNSVAYLGDFSFTDCYGLTNATIGSSSIRFGAFANCTGLTSITIGNGVAYIGVSAFRSCEELTSIEIPNSVITIGDDAFDGCTSLTSIEIPNSVTTIGNNAFYSCTGLRSVTIGNSVTTIGHYAFYSCTGLTSVTIGNSVTTIGDEAFYSCRNLTSITSLIPADKLFIPGARAFYNVPTRCKLYVPAGAKETYATTEGWNQFTNIVESANNFEVDGIFYNILSKEDKTVEVTYKGGNYYDYSNEYIGEVTIPANVTYNGTTYSVTTIGDNAFRECSSLASITIPNSVTTIGACAFFGCSRLTSIEIPNSVTTIENGMFFGCGLTSIEIPNSVTTIKGHAFYECRNLKSATIGNSVTTIGSYAFSLCNSLTSIEIPNSVTNIGDYAFESCSSLKDITIGSGVTTIRGAAFSFCNRLTSVTSLIPANNLFSVNWVFDGVDKNNCTLYVPYGAKETYAATEGWNEFTNIVELGPNEITITVNQYGCGTYCSPNALDFSNVKGLKAYSAIGYKPSTQTVTLARVMTTDAGQGIFIKGEPGEYNVPIIDNFDEYTLNLLVGTLEQTTVNSTDGNMSNFKFTIIEGEDTPMFYQFEDNTPYSANRAYLQIPTAWLPATAAQKSVSISFEEGETTGIDEVEEPTTNEGIIYNLQGQKVENPTRGIYIVNGKKVFIK